MLKSRYVIEKPSVRCRHLRIRFRSCFQCFFLLVSLIIFFVFWWTESYETDFEYFRSSFIETISSSWVGDDNSSITDFQAQIGQTFPSLPIHIFGQNLSLMKNESKLILLANAFFDNPTWGFAEAGKTSTEIMTSLSCPYLADRCDISTDLQRFPSAHAIVYHMRDNIDLQFASRRRQSKQIFVFALWESPSHTGDLKKYKNFFNWTMTYRRDSHVMASYYLGNSFLHRSTTFVRQFLPTNLNESRFRFNLKTVEHRPSDEFLSKKKLGTVAALISNCGGSTRRMFIIRQLKLYIDVHVYGNCGQPCPANVDCRQYLAENYFFFFAAENSFCTDYTTEKFFSTLEYSIVPIVYGRTNYSSLIPSSGFIDFSGFPTLKSLAEYLRTVRNDKNKYLSYFSWKKDFLWGWTNFFTPLCDLCVRLHLDKKPNVIDDIHKWWHEGSCVVNNFRT